MAAFNVQCVNGVVVELDENETFISSIQNGKGGHKEDSKNFNITGKEIDLLLSELLGEKGIQFKTLAARETLKQIRHLYCFAALDLHKEIIESKSNPRYDKILELPTGEMLSLGSERFLSVEALFDPSLAKKEGKGLPGVILDEFAHQQKTYEKLHVVLFGKLAHFGFLKERVKKQLIKTFESKNPLGPLQGCI